MLHLISVSNNAGNCGDTTVHHWQQPPTNTLKIDVDGAYAIEESSGAIGGRGQE
jgi:hypothetical protein